MDVKQSLGSLLSSIWLPLLFGILGIIALGYGFLSANSSDTSDDVVIETALEPTPVNDDENVIFIDVEGAVASPGVYALSPENRVQDAVVAAGGIHKDADRFIIAKSINMASKIADGMKIYIPFKGEEAVLTTLTDRSTAEVAGASTSLINLNSASQSTLEELSGVGPVTAKKIIDNRPYTSVNDLLTKKIVGQSVFDKIKDQITVN